jgi:5-methylcytosine-specific restriction endonuclease McrA
MDQKELMAAERERALKLFSKRHKPGFNDKTAFADWFVAQLARQNFSCHYCETAIANIQALIERRLLKTRKTGYGWRGRVLEVDKRSNHLGYCPENCVLACYYCNNDKSYTLDSEAYKRFFGPNRKVFFDYLITTQAVAD